MVHTEVGIEPAAARGADIPRRRGWVIALSVLAGFALTVVWSAPFVDQVIGDSVANTLLGHDAKQVPISGVLAGLAFAFVSGLAGTFTACNIAALGTIAPLLGERGSVRSRVRTALRPLGWLTVGVIAVSAVYGVIVAIIGGGMPQASTVTGATGLTPRSVQSMVTFGVIGLAFSYLGLAALGVVRDPLERLLRRFPPARMVVMGALIGGFLIGRPFGLFRQLFRNTADTHNALYGAVAFMLQSLGNIVVVSVVFLAVTLLAGRRVANWLAARPGRLALTVGAAFLVSGVFTLLYWDVRILARLGYIWYPVAPWS